MIILDILKYVGIAFFIRLGFVIYEGWKMSGQKPVDLCFSDDGKKILEVENAKNIIVNKRSMNAGYAGIDNLLFYDPKCSMFFGDAKKALTELVAEIKQL